MIYIVNQCQTVSNKLLNSCRTILIHNIILQIDIHCQSVSDKLLNSCKQYWYIILSCNLIYIVNQCQKVSNKLLNSCRTILIHNIILQFDIHCQSVSDKLLNSCKQYWYIILYCKLIYIVNQCQKAVNQCQTSCQTVAEHIYHNIICW